ncbi:MAG: hypothetical protein WCH62_00910, partial [Candidatus Omnitrophota bacterium]
NRLTEGNWDWDKAYHASFRPYQDVQNVEGRAKYNIDGSIMQKESSLGNIFVQNIISGAQMGLKLGPLMPFFQMKVSALLRNEMPAVKAVAEGTAGRTAVEEATAAGRTFAKEVSGVAREASAGAGTAAAEEASAAGRTAASETGVAARETAGRVAAEEASGAAKGISREGPVVVTSASGRAAVGLVDGAVRFENSLWKSIVNISEKAPTVSTIAHLTLVSNLTENYLQQQPELRKNLEIEGERQAQLNGISGQRAQVAGKLYADNQIKEIASSAAFYSLFLKPAAAAPQKSQQETKKAEATKAEPKLKQGELALGETKGTKPGETKGPAKPESGERPSASEQKKPEQMELGLDAGKSKTPSSSEAASSSRESGSRESAPEVAVASPTYDGTLAWIKELAQTVRNGVRGRNGLDESHAQDALGKLVGLTAHPKLPDFVKNAAQDAVKKLNAGKGNNQDVGDAVSSMLKGLVSGLVKQAEKGFAGWKKAKGAEKQLEARGQGDIAVKQLGVLAKGLSVPSAKKALEGFKSNGEEAKKNSPDALLASAAKDALKTPKAVKPEAQAEVKAKEVSPAKPELASAAKASEAVEPAKRSFSDIMQTIKDRMGRLRESAGVDVNGDLDKIKAHIEEIKGVGDAAAKVELARSLEEAAKGHANRAELEDMAKKVYDSCSSCVVVNLGNPQHSNGARELIRNKFREAVLDRGLSVKEAEASVRDLLSLNDNGHISEQGFLQAQQEIGRIFKDAKPGWGERLLNWVGKLQVGTAAKEVVKEQQFDTHAKTLMDSVLEREGRGEVVRKAPRVQFGGRDVTEEYVDNQGRVVMTVRQSGEHRQIELFDAQAKENLGGSFGAGKFNPERNETVIIHNSTKVVRSHERAETWAIKKIAEIRTGIKDGTFKVDEKTTPQTKKLYELITKEGFSDADAAHKYVEDMGFGVEVKGDRTGSGIVRMNERLTGLRNSLGKLEAKEKTIKLSQDEQTSKKNLQDTIKDIESRPEDYTGVGEGSLAKGRPEARESAKNGEEVQPPSKAPPHFDVKELRKAFETSSKDQHFNANAQALENKAEDNSKEQKEPLGFWRSQWELFTKHEIPQVKIGGLRNLANGLRLLTDNRWVARLDRNGWIAKKIDSIHRDILWQTARLRVGVSRHDELVLIDKTKSKLGERYTSKSEDKKEQEKEQLANEKTKLTLAKGSNNAEDYWKKVIASGIQKNTPDQMPVDERILFEAVKQMQKDNPGIEIGHKEFQLSIMHSAIEYYLDPSNRGKLIIVDLPMSFGKSATMKPIMAHLAKEAKGSKAENKPKGYLLVVEEGGVKDVVDANPEVFVAAKEIGLNYDLSHEDGQVVVVTHKQLQEMLLRNKSKGQGYKETTFKDWVVSIDEVHQLVTDPALTWAANKDVAKQYLASLTGRQRMEEKETRDLETMVAMALQEFSQGVHIDNVSENKMYGKKVSYEDRRLTEDIMKKLQAKIGSDAWERLKVLHNGNLNDFLDALANLHNSIVKGTIQFRIDESGNLRIDPKDNNGQGEWMKDRVFSDQKGFNAYSRAIMAVVGEGLFGVAKVEGLKGSEEAYAQHVHTKDSVRATGADVLQTLLGEASVMGWTATLGDARPILETLGAKFWQIQRNARLDDFILKGITINARKPEREIILEKADEWMKQNTTDGKFEDGKNLVLIFNSLRLAEMTPDEVKGLKGELRKRLGGIEVNIDYVRAGDVKTEVKRIINKNLDKPQIVLTSLRAAVSIQAENARAHIVEMSARSLVDLTQIFGRVDSYKAGTEFTSKLDETGKKDLKGEADKNVRTAGSAELVLNVEDDINLTTQQKEVLRSFAEMLSKATNNTDRSNIQQKINEYVEFGILHDMSENRGLSGLVQTVQNQAEASVEAVQKVQQEYGDRMAAQKAQERKRQLEKQGNSSDQYQRQLAQQGKFLVATPNGGFEVVEATPQTSVFGYKAQGYLSPEAWQGGLAQGKGFLTIGSAGAGTNQREYYDYQKNVIIKADALGKSEEDAWEKATVGFVGQMEVPLEQWQQDSALNASVTEKRKVRFDKTISPSAGLTPIGDGADKMEYTMHLVYDNLAGANGRTQNVGALKRYTIRAAGKFNSISHEPALDEDSSANSRIQVIDETTGQALKDEKGKVLQYKLVADKNRQKEGYHRLYDAQTGELKAVVIKGQFIKVKEENGQLKQLMEDGTLKDAMETPYEESVNFGTQRGHDELRGLTQYKFEKDKEGNWSLNGDEIILTIESPIVFQGQSLVKGDRIKKIQIPKNEVLRISDANGKIKAFVVGGRAAVAKKDSKTGEISADVSRDEKELEVTQEDGSIVTIKMPTAAHYVETKEGGIEERYSVVDTDQLERQGIRRGFIIDEKRGVLTDKFGNAQRTYYQGRSQRLDWKGSLKFELKDVYGADSLVGLGFLQEREFVSVESLTKLLGGDREKAEKYFKLLDEKGYLQKTSEDSAHLAVDLAKKSPEDLQNDFADEADNIDNVLKSVEEYIFIDPQSDRKFRQDNGKVVEIGLPSQEKVPIVSFSFRKYKQLVEFRNKKVENLEHNNSFIREKSEEGRSAELEGNLKEMEELLSRGYRGIRVEWIDGNGNIVKGPRMFHKAFLRKGHAMLDDLFAKWGMSRQDARRMVAILQNKGIVDDNGVVSQKKALLLMAELQANGFFSKEGVLLSADELKGKTISGLDFKDSGIEDLHKQAAIIQSLAYETQRKSSKDLQRLVSKLTSQGILNDQGEVQAQQLGALKAGGNFNDQQIELVRDILTNASNAKNLKLLFTSENTSRSNRLFRMMDALKGQLRSVAKDQVRQIMARDENESEADYENRVKDALGKLENRLSERSIELVYDPYMEKNGSAGLADNKRFSLGTSAMLNLLNLSPEALEAGVPEHELGHVIDRMLRVEGVQTIKGTTRVEAAVDLSGRDRGVYARNFAMGEIWTHYIEAKGKYHIAQRARALGNMEKFVRFNEEAVHVLRRGRNIAYSSIHATEGASRSIEQYLSQGTVDGRGRWVEAQTTFDILPDKEFKDENIRDVAISVFEKGTNKLQYTFVLTVSKDVIDGTKINVTKVKKLLEQTSASAKRDAAILDLKANILAGFHEDEPEQHDQAIFKAIKNLEQQLTSRGVVDLKTHFSGPEFQAPEAGLRILSEILGDKAATRTVLNGDVTYTNKKTGRSVTISSDGAISFGGSSTEAIQDSQRDFEATMKQVLEENVDKNNLLISSSQKFVQEIRIAGGKPPLYEGSLDQLPAQALKEQQKGVFASVHQIGTAPSVAVNFFDRQGLAEAFGRIETYQEGTVIHEKEIPKKTFVDEQTGLALQNNWGGINLDTEIIAAAYNEANAKVRKLNSAEQMWQDYFVKQGWIGKDGAGKWSVKVKVGLAVQVMPKTEQEMQDYWETVPHEIQHSFDATDTAYNKKVRAHLHGDEFNLTDGNQPVLDEAGKPVKGFDVFKSVLYLNNYKEEGIYETETNSFLTNNLQKLRRDFNWMENLSESEIMYQLRSEPEKMQHALMVKKYFLGKQYLSFWNKQQNVLRGHFDEVLNQYGVKGMSSPDAAMIYAKYQSEPDVDARSLSSVRSSSNEANPGQLSYGNQSSLPTSGLVENSWETSDSWTRLPLSNQAGRWETLKKGFWLTTNALSLLMYQGPVTLPEQEVSTSSRRPSNRARAVLGGAGGNGIGGNGTGGTGTTEGPTSFAKALNGALEAAYGISPRGKMTRVGEISASIRRSLAQDRIEVETLEKHVRDLIGLKDGVGETTAAEAKVVAAAALRQSRVNMELADQLAHELDTSCSSCVLKLAANGNQGLAQAAIAATFIPAYSFTGSVNAAKNTVISNLGLNDTTHLSPAEYNFAMTVVNNTFDQLAREVATVTSTNGVGTRYNNLEQTSPTRSLTVALNSFERNRLTVPGVRSSLASAMNPTIPQLSQLRTLGAAGTHVNNAMVSIGAAIRNIIKTPKLGEIKNLPPNVFKGQVVWRINQVANLLVFMHMNHNYLRPLQEALQKANPSFPIDSIKGYSIYPAGFGQKKDVYKLSVSTTDGRTFQYSVALKSNFERKEPLHENGERQAAEALQPTGGVPRHGGVLYVEFSQRGKDDVNTTSTDFEFASVSTDPSKSLENSFELEIQEFIDGANLNTIVKKQHKGHLPQKLGVDAAKFIFGQVLALNPTVDITKPEASLKGPWDVHWGNVFPPQAGGTDQWKNVDLGGQIQYDLPTLVGILLYHYNFDVMEGKVPANVTLQALAEAYPQVPWKQVVTNLRDKASKMKGEVDLVGEENGEVWAGGLLVKSDHLKYMVASANEFLSPSRAMVTVLPKAFDAGVLKGLLKNPEAAKSPENRAWMIAHYGQKVNPAMKSRVVSTNRFEGPRHVGSSTVVSSRRVGGGIDLDSQDPAMIAYQLKHITPPDNLLLEVFRAMPLPSEKVLLVINSVRKHDAANGFAPEIDQQNLKDIRNAIRLAIPKADPQARVEYFQTKGVAEELSKSKDRRDALAELFEVLLTNEETEVLVLKPSAEIVAQAKKMVTDIIGNLTISNEQGSVATAVEENAAPVQKEALASEGAVIADQGETPAVVQKALATEGAAISDQGETPAVVRAMQGDTTATGEEKALQQASDENLPRIVE